MKRKSCKDTRAKVENINKNQATCINEEEGKKTNRLATSLHSPSGGTTIEAGGDRMAVCNESHGETLLLAHGQVCLGSVSWVNGSFALPADAPKYRVGLSCQASTLLPRGLLQRASTTAWGGQCQYLCRRPLCPHWSARSHRRPLGIKEIMNKSVRYCLRWHSCSFWCTIFQHH